jgi:hypothetical protein
VIAGGVYLFYNKFCKRNSDNGGARRQQQRAAYTHTAERGQRVNNRNNNGSRSPKYVYQEENWGQQMVDFQPQEPDLDEQSGEKKMRRQPVPAAADPKKKTAPQPRISNNPQKLRKLSV